MTTWSGVRGRSKSKRAAATCFVLAAGAALAACSGKGGNNLARAESASSKASRSTTAAPPTAADSNHVMLFIGTSLTAGLGLNPDSAYPQLIQAKIDSARLPFEVVNAGVSGETSAGLVRRLDWLLRGAFDIAVVESGANDGLRGTPTATMRENLRQIVKRIRETHPAARIFLIQMEAPPNLGREYTAAFHAVFPDVARETGASLLPFLLDGVAGNPSLNQGDGIHPNQRGEHIVADNVWRGLKERLGARE